MTSRDTVGLNLLKNKGFKEERMTKVGWYAVDTSTTLESNKSLRQIAEPEMSGDWKLSRIVQPRVPEPAGAMHFQIGDERVPVRHCTPSGPGMEVDTAQT